MRFRQIRESERSICPYFCPYSGPDGVEMDGIDGPPIARNRSSQHMYALNGCRRNSYTIFEGTSEIQRLVIARALSGVHIA
jgi:hypothetical protein